MSWGIKLTKYSQARFDSSLHQYGVNQEYAGHLKNYLVDGLPPGSFFNALLANNALAMLSHSHPSNSIPELKKLTSWIVNEIPRTAYGSQDKVSAWLKMTDEQRRTALEKAGLLYTEQEEIVLVLKDAPIRPLY